jgi:hypothetical protein
VKAAGRSRQAAAPFRRGAGAWWIAALLLVASPGAAQGRGGTVQAIPVQGLRFGLLSAGAPSVVSPLDAGQRATLELAGSGHVTLTFELPAGLASRGGATLPLRFGPGDGRIVFARSSREIVFDPNQPVSFNLPQGLGSATVYLGGSAQPAPGQPPGEYTAAITVFLVVANTST